MEIPIAIEISTSACLPFYVICPLSADFIHIYSDPQAGAAKSSVDMASGEKAVKLE